MRKQRRCYVMLNVSKHTEANICYIIFILISALTNLDSLTFSSPATMVWLVNMADTDRPKRNSTEATPPQQQAQEGERGCFKRLGRVIEWGLFWWSPFEQRACCFVWLLSLVCSLVVSGCHRCAAGRRGLQPQLGQPAAAPAGADPVHRADQKGGPGDAVRSASCWRRRRREWVLTEEYTVCSLNISSGFTLWQKKIY